MSLLHRVFQSSYRVKTSPEWVNSGLISLADKQCEYDWEATDPDAGIIIESGFPMVGWNMIELEIDHDQQSGAARFILDSGQGFDRDHSFYLSVQRGKTSKRICFIPYGVKRIRIEPLSVHGGCFTIKKFQFVWLTPRFAYNRMLRRLDFADRNFQGAGVRNILSALRGEAREDNASWKKLLLSRYEATFAYGAPNFSYEAWKNQIEPLREPTREKLTRAIHDMSNPPRFGVVLTRGILDDRMFDASVGSLLAQRYGHWELFVPEELLNRRGRSFFARNMKRDSRIHLLPQAEGVSILDRIKALNISIHYIYFMRPSDRLQVNAFYHYAVLIDRHPQYQLIYTDDDILEEGVRILPNFKPRWNPDFLLSNNYIGSSAFFAFDRLDECRNYLQDFPSLNFHRLLLGFTQGMTDKVIGHAPYITVSRVAASETEIVNSNVTPIEVWKENSTSYSVDAVREFMDNDNFAVKVVEVEGKGCHVMWPIPESAPLVSLLVPTHNMVNILKPCIDTILNITDYSNFEILILDNNSDDPETLAYLLDVQRDPRIKVIKWDNAFNYSAINNYGVQYARGEILGLINNDVEPLNSSWLTEMVGQVCRAEIGCVGAKLYYPNDTIQHGGVILGLGGIAGHAHRFYSRWDAGYQDRLVLAHDLSAVTAACLLVRKSIFLEVGGLNEQDLPIAYNDVDLCLKIREAGYTNIWTPFAELYHHESISRGKDDSPRKKARAKREVDYLINRWRPQLLDDPAYNPNLTIGYEDFSFG